MKRDSSSQPPKRRRAWIPYYILGLSLLLATLATYYVAKTTEDSDRRRFERTVQRSQDNIQNRLETHIALLQASSGLFAVSQQVSQKQFAAFVDRLELRKHYPGMQGIGFSVLLRPEEKDEFVASLRRQGLKNYTIRPGSKRAEYHAIAYLEPLDRRNQTAIGFDMFTESVRRAAMESARDTGAPAASGRVTLLQEIDPHKQAGFLIYVPVYRNGAMPKTVAERRRQLKGFVYSPFRADDLMQEIFGSEKYPSVDVEIYDGTELRQEYLLHSSYSKNPSSRTQDKPRFKTTTTINVAGRLWRINFAARSQLDEISGMSLVPYIALGGATISLVLFAVVRSLVLARNAAERLAASLLQSEDALRESELRLRRLFDADIIGIIIGDCRGNIIEANDAFLNMLGYARPELLTGNLNFLEITPPEYRPLDDRAIEDLQLLGKHAPFEKEYIRKDGTHVPVLVGTAYLGGADELSISFLLDLTDQKRTEEAMRRSEIRFRTLIEQSPLSTQIFSPDGRTIQVNQAWEELWSVTLDRLGDYNILEDEQLSDKGIMPYIKKGFAGIATAIPPIFYDPDRTIPGITVRENPQRWVRANIYPVKDEAGNIREVVLIHEDITDRKLAEERFRRLFDSNLIGIAFWNINGWISDANDAYLNIAGYSKEEFVANGGLNWKELTPPEYKHLDDRSIAECLESGVSNLYEKEYVRRDGQRVPLVVGVALMKDSQNDGVAFVLDITDRKKAMRALRESEERFQAFMNNSPTAAWISDEDGRIVYLSQTYCRMFDMPIANPIGKTVFEMYAAEFAQQYLDNIRMVANSNRAIEAIETAPRPDGTVGDFLVYKFPISDASGRRLVGGVAIDISDRKRAEEEREQLLVREQMARAEAEAANRLKDDFLATLSHELRTPLSAMMGWTTLLKTRQFDEATTARALETIDRNTKTLAQLIEDLLDVSRIMTGKFRLDMRPVELSSVILSAIEAVQATADAKNILIHSTFEPLDCLVSGDAIRLQQIVWNLLANAIKFTPKGGRANIHLYSDNYSAIITVSDNGKGISEEFLPYIFERFRQADGAITRTHGGLGLGLAIVRHLVELHAGSIRAYSAGEGQGTTFTVELPLLQESRLILARSSINGGENESQRSLPSKDRSLDGLWVLVVDDELDARSLLTIILEESGAEVTAVGSAHLALEIIADNSLGKTPNILVSDIAMPGEDGYSLIRKIRMLAPEKGGRIPAAALTAYAGAQERSRALEAGFQIHLPKPIVPEELVAVVASLVGFNL